MPQLTEITNVYLLDKCSLMLSLSLMFYTGELIGKNELSEKDFCNTYPD